MHWPPASAGWSTPISPLESALIQALQVKQELSAQSVGIVNSAPHTLLSLFRG